MPLSESAGHCSYNVTSHTAVRACQRVFVQVPGGLELLQAAGFQLDLPHSASLDDDNSRLVYTDDSKLTLASQALAQIQGAMPSGPVAGDRDPALHRAASGPASASNAGSSSAGTAPPAIAPLPAALAGSAPRPQAAAAAAAAPPQSISPSSGPSSAADRPTQVIIPAAPDTQVPDWFFDRTSADVKLEYKSTVLRRQRGEVLMTRAMREQQASKAGKPKYSHATLRVRFPEGVLLQADFGANEALSAIHEWLSACLCSPALEYELVLPSRKHLPMQGRVRDQDLMPACLLNFRVVGEEAALFKYRCALSDVLLAQAQVH